MVHPRIGLVGRPLLLVALLLIGSVAGLAAQGLSPSPTPSLHDDPESMAGLLEEYRRLALLVRAESALDEAAPLGKEVPEWTPSFEHRATDGFFAEHIRDARRLNRERRRFYDQRSGGLTRPLSRRLILLETATLAVAHAIDRWARRYQRQGVPLLQSEFVSMHQVKPPAFPPLRRQVADAGVRQAFLDLVRHFPGKARELLNDGDFAACAELCATTLDEVHRLELIGQCHFAMTLHLLESLGLGARNALGYRRQTGGQTDRFMRVFLKAQLAGFRAFAALDLPAQEAHAMGVGFLVNDLPPIPFP